MYRCGHGVIGMKDDGLVTDLLPGLYLPFGHLIPQLGDGGNTGMVLGPKEADDFLEGVG